MNLGHTVLSETGAEKGSKNGKFLICQDIKRKCEVFKDFHLPFFVDPVHGVVLMRVFPGVAFARQFAHVFEHQVSRTKMFL